MQPPLPPPQTSNSVLYKALNGVFRPERRLVCPADWVFLVVAYQHFHQPFWTPSVTMFGRKLSLMFQFVTHHFLQPWTMLSCCCWGFESKLPGYLIKLSVLYNEKVFVLTHIFRLVTERTLTTSTINKKVAWNAEGCEGWHRSDEGKEKMFFKYSFIFECSKNWR